MGFVDRRSGLPSGFGFMDHRRAGFKVFDCWFRACEAFRIGDVGYRIPHI